MDRNRRVEKEIKREREKGYFNWQKDKTISECVVTRSDIFLKKRMTLFMPAIKMKKSVENHTSQIKSHTFALHPIYNY